MQRTESIKNRKHAKNWIKKTGKMQRTESIKTGKMQRTETIKTGKMQITKTFKKQEKCKELNQ